MIRLRSRRTVGQASSGTRLCPPSGMFFLFLMLSIGLSTTATAQPTEQQIAQAVELCKKSPNPDRTLGLAEIYRTAGKDDEALNLLQTADDAQKNVATLETLAWRMLADESASPADWRCQATRLADVEPPSPWAGVLGLYAALVEGDRPAALKAAEGLAVPERFPTVAAEQAHLNLLTELGQSLNAAGLEVIRHRDYRPLYALRDLDRRLTREAEFLESSGQADGAASLRNARDRLREGWLACSKHLVERLFALKLLDRQQQRGELAERAKNLGWLTDVELLERRLASLPPPAAWRNLIDPMLQSEVDLVMAMSPSEPTPVEVKTPLVVRAPVKRTEGSMAVYAGRVEVTLGPIEMSCRRLSLATDAKDGSAVLNGSGDVVIRRLPGYETRITADRISFDTGQKKLTVEGGVCLQGAKGTLTCERCVVTIAGEVVEKRTLLDEFAEAKDVRQKLALLPRITKAHGDDELTPEASYLLAMKLLVAHLSWHADYAPPHLPDRREELIEVVEQLSVDRDDLGRWAPAHGGESWMLDESQRKRLRQARDKEEQQAADVPASADDPNSQDIDDGRPDEPEFFWRLKDPEHADVARAVKLLRKVGEGDLARRARHWLDEIERNNTVVAMDVAGAYAQDEAGPVVVDVRNADRLAVKLYRVRRPIDLVSVTAAIGEDFVYHDYGLQYGPRLQRLKEARSLHAMQQRLGRQYAREIRRRPQLKPEDLVKAWDVAVAELEPLDLGRSEYDRWDDWDDYYDEYDQEAEYFDDRCERHRDRLEKTYWPGLSRRSSWRCDRLLSVPGEALKQPGAYVLCVEANRQTAYAPIVVDPLSMVLRRCRDGVFVMLSDTEAKGPVAGAEIHAAGQLGHATTNADGVTFAKVFAAGDRAIVAEKDGRYAVGGFGEVFDGIYKSDLDDELQRMHVDRVLVAREQLKLADVAMTAHAYIDRYLVAAYTDRPTYRPGQEVNFKLIVRRMPPAEVLEQVTAEKEFRSGDFELSTSLEVPDDLGDVRFEVLNPKGRVVGSGTAELSDFGTAAGSVTLSSEAKVGTYTLRVHTGDTDRIVPEVFAVKYYRRPNFEVQVTGLPEVIIGGKVLELKLIGRYYFGKPVSDSEVDVRLVRPRGWKPLVSSSATLDDGGSAQLELELPEELPPGDYRLIASLTDRSGRTVTKILACHVEGDQRQTADDFSRLSRFVEVNAVLEVATAADEVKAEKVGGDTPRRLSFKVERGIARVKLPAPGWYMLSSGTQQTEIFAYGGWDPPEREPAAATEGAPRWVNLTDYEFEEDGTSRRMPEPADLWALFDRQHVDVGDTLRLLVHAPAEGTRLLLTVEGRTVVDYFVVRPAQCHSSGDYHVVEIPVEERHVPNFYLQGRIIAGSDVPQRLQESYEHEQVLQELAEEEIDDASEDPRWCRVDVFDPNRRPGGQTLNVAVETDAAKYAPGDPVEVTIRTTDLTGRPVEAEVSLAAVDASVYSFGEDRLDLLPTVFSDPRPPRRYQRKTWRIGRGRTRPAEMAMVQEAMAQAMEMARQAESSAQLQQSLDSLEQIAGYPRPESLVPNLAMLEGELPASSIPIARLRTDFRETAAWLPQLRTDADGMATTSFKLPDSLTRYRLTGVGLTRDTRIGVGRKRIEASMPLAVQLFLPRQAVQGDRLAAVGVIHNNTDQKRTCKVVWEVSGASVDPVGSSSQPWQLMPGDDKTIARGTVTVAPNESARIAVPLNIDRLDDVQITLRVADRNDADAVVRSMQVQPAGRAREIALCGTFTGEHKLNLPAGFIAQDLRVSLSRTDVAGGLEGLAYLVDYPYGCVEQTMSRFLPAVMVRRALKQTALELPPEVAEKLPDVLAKGLERLYNFQHDDGGWGWWEKDQSDDRMTIYVVYGLARCRGTDTPVDSAVLARGCSYLTGRLESGKLPESLRPGALLALALVGKASEPLVRREVEPLLRDAQPGAAAAYLALACRHTASIEAGERLWAKVRHWQPQSTEDLALKLVVQIAYAAPLAECRATADELLARRQGHRWGNTRATAWAVEALAQMLRYDPVAPKAKRLAILVDGRPALELADPDQLKKPVSRVHLRRDELPTTEGLAIAMRVESDRPVRYAVTATGIERLDHAEPEGDAIRLHRSLTTPDGKPLPERLNVGDVVAVRLALELEDAQSYLIVEDRLPAGCQFADDRLDGPAARQAANVEFRDDRFCAFFTSLPAGHHELVYYLRAETPGQTHMLPGIAYPMYHEQLRGQTGSLKLLVDQ